MTWCFPCPPTCLTNTCRTPRQQGMTLTHHWFLTPRCPWFRIHGRLQCSLSFPFFIHCAPLVRDRPLNRFLMLNRERWPKWSSTKATSSAGVHARKGTPIALLVRCFNDGDIGELWRWWRLGVVGMMANFVALECWCTVVNLSVRAQIAAKNSRTLHRFSNSTNKFKLVVKWKEFHKSKTKKIHVHSWCTALNKKPW